MEWVLKKLDNLIIKAPFIFTIDNMGNLMQWAINGQLKQDWGTMSRNHQISAAISQDNKYLFILSKSNHAHDEGKNHLRQLDVQDCSLIANWHEIVGSNVQSFGIFSPPGKCQWLYTAHKNGVIKQWDLKSKLLYKEMILTDFRPAFLQHPMPITPDGKKLFIFNKIHKTLLKIRIKDLRVVKDYDFSDSNFVNEGVIMKMSKDGKFLFTSDANRICKQISVENDLAFLGHYEQFKVDGNIYCSRMAIAPDGRELFVSVSTSKGNLLYIWSTKKRKIKRGVNFGGLKEVEDIAVNGNGRYLYMTGVKKKLGYLLVVNIKMLRVVKNFGAITKDEILPQKILINF